MRKKLIINPAPMTYEAFLKLGNDRSLPIEEIGNGFKADVEALEHDFGPQVPTFLCRKGRPAKGIRVDPVQPRVVKMPPAFWVTMAALAEESGLTLHAAMREALVKWTRDHGHPKTG